MPKIKIDGEEIDIEELSVEAQAQISSIRFIDSEIARLHASLAALKTARIAYGKAVKNSIDGNEDLDGELNLENLGENIEF